MAYFPAFLQLDNKKVLLVGGGNIAYEKIEKLLDFTNDIKIIALDVNQQMKDIIKKNNLELEVKAYVQGDIKDFSLVVIAVDDIALQAEIFNESKDYKCLCNAVDSVNYCDFIFPSYVKENDLTIAISTSGASPAFAKHFKSYIKGLIPSNVSDFLKEMKELRQTLPKGKERMIMLDKKVQRYMKEFKNV